MFPRKPWISARMASRWGPARPAGLLGVLPAHRHRGANKVRSQILCEARHSKEIRANSRLISHASRADDVFHRVGVASGRAVPDTSAEGGDVDFRRVVRVGNYAVTPFEIEAANARPGDAPIGGAIGAGLKA